VQTAGTTYPVSGGQEAIMLHLQSQIDIDVPVGDAFRLLCDPARKAELNPKTGVVHVAVAGGGTLGPGSRVHYRLNTSNGLQSFHCTVTAFIPNRLIEMESDTNPPFRVRQSLEATLYGCRLLHEEWMEIGPAQVQADSRERPLSTLKRLLQEAVGHGMPTPAALSRRQMELLEENLQQTLGEWLANIKASLETAGQGELTEQTAVNI